MSRFQSRLTRQELYSYGFKEGQPWGDDRRALESALREIDQHEREIQENYIYTRPAHSSNSGSWLPSSAPRHYPTTNAGGHYLPPSPRYPPDIVRMNRSNQSDDSYSSPAESSQVAPRSNRASGYEHSRTYRDYPRSPGYVTGSGQSGRSDRFYYPADNDTTAAIFRRSSGSRRTASSPQNTQNYAGQYAAPPLGSSTSSYRNFNAMEDSSKLPEAPSYYHPESVLNSPHSRRPTSGPFSPSGQTQLVRYAGDQGKPPQDDHPDADHYSSPPPTSPNTDSPRWSVTTTHGTGSENLSMDSSQGSQSENSALSGYTDGASRLSGYVESYDVHSHLGPYYHEHYRDHHDSEEADQDYMSDGVASDEGVYYSSGEGEGDGDDGEEVFSDEGYSSFSEDDASYSDFE